MHSTHAHPTDSQSSGDTLSEDMLTELTSSGEVIIPTEPVSSGEPPTNGSKTRACSDGETKGKEYRLKTTPGIINLLGSIANKENNKLYLKITGKQCDGKSSTINVERIAAAAVWNKNALDFGKKCWISYSVDLFYISRR